MRQAILVRRLPPTNTRGLRIAARIEGQSQISPYDHALSADANALTAAARLRDARQLAGELVGGVLPNGDRVFVLV